MNSSEVFDRLSAKSLNLLKKLNPDFETLKEITLGKILVTMIDIDDRFENIAKELGFTSKSRHKINLAEWLVTAYYEANLINSEKVIFI